MRVLELGQYISIGYAGMVLAEQGHQVVKWTDPGGRADPTLEFVGGDQLWTWLCEGKQLRTAAFREVTRLLPGDFDIIIDNVRVAAWERWQVNLPAQAKRLGVTWVSMRDEFGGRSFDAIAQARAWGDHLGCVPAYLGDTGFGLWAAFKALAAPAGHHVITQAACLAKLVEGELAAELPRPRDGKRVPWERPGEYGPDGDGVTVMYRGQPYHEPYRDDAWRREHLPHAAGRYII